ncbi:MAG: NUDIX domain-containing protein [Chitinophagaceae bacterium]|nr:NUDIX domain-containing protein [Chitinophagaceae bacterium]
MHIKIYFEDKPVFLCDELTTELNELLRHPDAVFIDELSANALKSLLHEIVKPEFHAGVVIHKDLSKLKKAFFKNFTLIEAAGGIVQNESKEILFIERLGKWDLPKGKMEKGETEEEAAVREVEEETGVKGLKLKRKEGKTYHTYNAFGKHFLKTTHWYYMQCKNEQHLKPQSEESITDIKWVSTKNIKEPMANTYPSIKDILRIFFDEP